MIVHYLDDDLSPQIKLSRKEHLPHSPFTKEADGFISAQEYTANHEVGDQAQGENGKVKVL